MGTKRECKKKALKQFSRWKNKKVMGGRIQDGGTKQLFYLNVGKDNKYTN